MVGNAKSKPSALKRFTTSKVKSDLTFFKELYLKSEQIGGKTCLNTQEMILELWDKLNSNERNWFVSHVMDNSIQSPNGNSKESNEMK